MTALTIKNLPDDLYDQLKASARIHHRSINSELIHCLETTLKPRKVDPHEVLAAARTLRAQVRAQSISAGDINAAKRDGRA